LTLKKNHNKLYCTIFIVLLLSGGFPLLSFPFPNAEATHTTTTITQDKYGITNYDVITNLEYSCNDSFFLIWQDYHHVDDENDNGYLCIRFSPEGTDSTDFTHINIMDDVELGREETTMTQRVGEGTYKTSLGLTKWIQTNEGEWTERLVNDNVNGTQIESGIFSFYYDKDSCGMSVFDNGRISSEYSIPLVKSNSWVVKSALNGTDNWNNLPQNILPCNTVVVDDIDHTMITVTRSDSNGVFTETYDLPKPIRDFKTTLTYQNNDPALNGTHKFAFTNVLNDVPDHLTILLKNSTVVDGDPVDLPTYFHYSSSPNTIPLQYDPDLTTYINGTIDIPRSEFFIYPDILNYNQTDADMGNTSLTTGFEMHYFSELAQKTARMTYYFVNDSMDKIWNLKLVNNGLTNDIIIDYMNNGTVLFTGDTVSLDPTANLISLDTHQVTQSGGFFGIGGCAENTNSPAFGTDFTTTTSFIGGMIGGRFSVCTIPIFTFDIFEIPDLASVLQADINYNITAVSVPFGTLQDRWFLGTDEEVTLLGGSTAGATIMVDFTTPDADSIPENISNPSGVGERQALFPTPVVGATSFTAVDPSSFTDGIELQLESGKNFLLLSACLDWTSNEFTMGVATGCNVQFPTSSSLSISRSGDINTLTFDIEWEIFSPPSEPLNVVATYSASPDKCFIDWDSPISGGGTLITGYQIQRDSGAGDVVIVADTGSATPTSFTDSTIVSGVSFIYTITAINDQGLGTPSARSNGCGVPELPSAPFGLTATNVALGVVGLDWSAPFFDGNSPITGYNVTRINATQQITILDGDTGSPLREFIDNTVDDETQYGYNVAAINIIGQSPFSNTALITTFGLPPPPSNVQATATGTSTMTVTWTAPEVGSTTITGYQIDRKLNFTGIFTTIDPFTGNDDTTFNDAFLTAGTEFCYQLKTFTNIGVSVDFSVENQATTCATTQDQSDPPANMTATAVDGSSINVSWDTPLDDGGSSITGYKIERQKEANPFLILFTERQPESNRILNDTGLEIGTLYTYRVTAITSFGDGESGTASDTTDATPQAPPNFTCSAGSTTSITLNWDTPITFSAPTGYQIDRRTVGGGFSTLVADTADIATQFIDDGLPVDSTFEYRVLGHTPEGDTDFSQIITCITLGVPDFPPEDLQGDFTQTIPHQMVLAWDIPNTFGIPITEFRIERDDGAGFNEITTVSGSTSIFIDQDPDNDIDQSYRIFTVGTEGDSASSTAIPFPANQTSHWHYENTIDDTGENKNTGTIFGVANFNGTGHVGKAFIFNNTRIEVDSSQESDYDFNNSTSFGITSYYKAQAGATIPAFDDEWQIREQEINVVFTVNCNFNITPPFSIDMTLNTGVGFCHVFKVFDKADIVGKVLNVTWAGSGSSADMRTRVYDGSYDRDTPSDFPLTTGTNGFTSVLKGGGVLHAIDRTSVFSSVTDSVTMTMAGSTLPQVTIAVSLRDPSNTLNQFMDLTEIEIIGLETWTWDSSSTRTMEVTGTQNDKGFSNANFTQNTFVSTDQVVVAKAQTLTDTGYKFYVDKNGKPSVKLTNTDTSNEIFVQATTDVTDDTLHFIGFGYNGNGTASGISMNIDGSSVTPSIITDTLTGSILNNEALNIGGTSTGTNFLLNATIDETRIFGSGTLDEDSLVEVANDEIETMIPINATITIAGSTFADISSETPLIIMTSGYPLPTINTIDLFNFTATNVNTQTVGLIIDGVSGQFTLDPSLFNIMGSLSNYTATGSLTNSEETFPLLSNFDLQTPLFTFSGDFFFQQQRNPSFDILSFNYTQTVIPFDLACNFKSTLFGNGTTVEFNDVFFVQHLQPVPQLEDVVVACIDQNTIIVDPTAPSFGGINAILSFVSFGDTTGVGNFLQFTNNYGDFFGVGLPFLFIIILAAAFTGRSAPTGILIIAISIGIMWAMGILEVDPFMWGIILVLVILGLLGGKKFL
jgi:hypothetical protein